MLRCLFLVTVFTFSSVCSSAPLFLHQARFHAVRGLHGVVVSQEQQAADIGRDVLREGGNAVDAAVATGFALMVTLPRAGGLGGGGFMTLWLQRSHQALMIDYRETAPQRIKPGLFLGKNRHIDKQKAVHSGLSIAVPGTVAGLCFAEKKYGKLGLKKVIQPAIQLATRGIRVTQALAAALKGSRQTLKTDPKTFAMFTDANGQLVRQGDILKRRGLARTLTLIRDNGPRAFYTGSIAKAIVSTVDQHSGVMTRKDLQSYHPVVRSLLKLPFHGYTVLAPPSPTSGLVLLQLLKMSTAFSFNYKHIKQNTAQEYHLLIEMMNFAFHDRNRYLADPAFETVPVKRLLSSEHISAMLSRISMKRHLPSVEIQATPVHDGEGVNTTHFSVVDEQGDMVSNTYSLNYSFGSGISVPHYGILLNNTMDDFALLPGSANSFGLVQGKANRVEPGKRPLSSMTPIIVLHDNQAWLATGSPGGSRIITTVFQLLLNMIDYNMDVATATERPRIHSQLFPDQVAIEDGVSHDTLALLKSMGHKIVSSWTQGSLQSVLHNRNGYYGFSDTRRLGAGVATY